METTVNEGNWDDAGLLLPAPPADVVRFLGEENRNQVIARGVLKLIAAFPDETWFQGEGGWEFMSSINIDCIGSSGVAIDGISDRCVIKPPSRRYEPRTELTGPLYDIPDLKP